MPRPKGVSQLEILRRRSAEATEQLQAAEAKERERLAQIDALRREAMALHIGDHLRAKPEHSFSVSVFAFLAGKITRPAERALFPELPARPVGRKTTNATGQFAAGETA